MPTTTITISEAIELINNSRGRFMGITYQKKDGQVSNHVIRTGVKMGKGVRRSYAIAGVRKVFYSATRRQPRMLYYKSIKEIRFQGQTYTVVADVAKQAA